MEFTLPMPHTFSEDSLVWKDFKHLSERFKRHVNSTFPPPLPSDPYRSSSLLLHIAGGHVDTIVSSTSALHGVSLSALSKILELVEELCLPYLLLLLERFKFFTQVQQEFETQKEFLNRLLFQVDHCQFGKMKETVLRSVLESQGIDKNAMETFFPDGEVCVVGRVGAQPCKEKEFAEAMTMTEGIQTTDSVPDGDDIDKKHKDLESYGGINLMDYPLINSHDTGKVPSKRPKQKPGRKKKPGPKSGGRKKEPRPKSGGRKTKRDVASTTGQAVKKENEVVAMQVMPALDENSSVNSVSHSETANQAKTTRVEQKKKFTCELCDKAFTFPKKLQRHILEKHSESTKNLCQTCGKYFADPDDLKMHMIVHNVCKKVYVCEYCPKTFRWKGRFDMHIKRHLGQRDYQCEVCGKSFVDKHGLKIHKRKHDPNSKAKLYTCADCNRSFPHRSLLRNHLRIHTGEKPFTCEYCGVSFAQSGTLQIHRRTHNGELPYMCKVCGKRTRSAADLSKHMPVHTREKAFVCKTCGKAFPYHAGLAQHRVTHTGERPYVCGICGNSYMFPSGLRRHKMRHDPSGSKPVVNSRVPKITPPEPVPVPVCTAGVSTAAAEAFVYSNMAVWADARPIQWSPLNMAAHGTQ